MYDTEALKTLVDKAAGGRSPADLLIINARVVDVFTGEIRETPVSIGNGKISRLCPHGSSAYCGR